MNNSPVNDQFYWLLHVWANQLIRLISKQQVNKITWKLQRLETATPYKIMQSNNINSPQKRSNFTNTYIAGLLCYCMCWRGAAVVVSAPVSVVAHWWRRSHVLGSYLRPLKVGEVGLMHWFEWVLLRGGVKQERKQEKTTSRDKRTEEEKEDQRRGGMWREDEKHHNGSKKTRERTSEYEGVSLTWSNLVNLFS